MRKSTLFISAVLTTFILAVLYGVVSAYQNIIKSTEVATVQSQPVTSTEVAQVIPPTQIPAQVVNLTPEEAAALASKVLGRNDLYSVEVTQFEGVDGYLVTFSSGDLVYLSLDGQVLSISKLPVTVVVQKTGKGNGEGGGGNAKNSSDGEHESEDHENEDHEVEKEDHEVEND